MAKKTPSDLNDEISGSKFLSGEFSPQDVRGPLLDIIDSVLLRQDTNRETLSANKSLASDDPSVQFLSPDAARTVTLPAMEDGLIFIIGNAAGAANALTVENAGNSTLETLSDQDVGLFYSDGSGWMSFTVAGTVS